MSDARAATDGGLPDQIEQIVGVLAVTSMNLSLEDWNTISNVLLDGAARIRELEARQVPDGWQVVPKEPTVAMERSATGRDTRDEGIASMYSGIYRAMLAAAPRP